MSTRAAILIPSDEGDWLAIYSHYDGYPEHMLPALANADPDAIRTAREIRQLHPNGEIDAFTDPRTPARLAQPAIPEWAEHAYVLSPDGWKHIAA